MPGPSTNASRRRGGQPKDVPPAVAALGRRPQLLDLETRVLKPRLELTIWTTRPHGQNAVCPERKARTLQPPPVVKAIVGPPREAFRSIVDVEQDGIVL